MKVILSSVAILMGYLIGALPTGFLIARANGIKDITKRGSGNVGATNVARLLGTYYFFIVFLLDAAKAFLYLKVLNHFDMSEIIQIGAAVALLIGNGYSVFLKGYGGKGVATSIGIIGALLPHLLLFLVAVWSGALLITQTVGIASSIALGTLPCISWYFFCSDILLSGLIIFISLWGLYRHRENVMKYVKNNI